MVLINVYLFVFGPVVCVFWLRLVAVVVLTLLFVFVVVGLLFVLSAVVV